MIASSAVRIIILLYSGAGGDAKMTGKKGDLYKGVPNNSAAAAGAAPAGIDADTEQIKLNKSQAKKSDKAKKKRRFSKTPDNTDCQNCGATLKGDHCHVCGQAAKEPRRLVIGLVQDVFVETLAIDGKLFRSIGLLLWRPGLLARRFLEGKRTRYSPPFRLFLFASVFFFFAASLLINVPESLPIDGDATLDPADLAEAQEGLAEAKEEVAAAFGGAAPEIVEEVFDELDASLAAAPNTPPIDAAAVEATSVEEKAAGEPKKSFKEMQWEDFDYSGPEWLTPHIKQLVEAGQRVVDDPRLFYAELRSNLPRFLLLAPVIYGLTLTLLYFYRRKFFIYDHFIVSLYMHAALYAYLLLALLASRAPVVGSWLWLIPVGWGALQPLLVLRQAYGSNWFSVWIKWFISTTIYVMALAVIILLGLSYSLYQS